MHIFKAKHDEQNTEQPKANEMVQSAEPVPAAALTALMHQ